MVVQDAVLSADQSLCRLCLMVVATDWLCGRSAGCSECCSVAPLAAVFIPPDEVMLFVVG